MEKVLGIRLCSFIHRHAVGKFLAALALSVYAISRL